MPKIGNRKFQFGLRARVLVPGYADASGLIVARTQDVTAENSYRVEFSHQGAQLSGTFGESGLAAANPVIVTAQSFAAPESVADFVAACVVAAPGKNVAARALYRAYLEWSLAHDRDPVTQRRFAMTIGAQVERDRDAHIRKYLNIALRPTRKRKK